MITEIEAPGVKCQCDEAGCRCTDDADFRVTDGTAICACCSVDCSDVHPEGDEPNLAGQP